MINLLRNSVALRGQKSKNNAYLRIQGRKHFFEKSTKSGGVGRARWYTRHRMWAVALKLEGVPDQPPYASVKLWEPP